jgi:nitroreductase
LFIDNLIEGDGMEVIEVLQRRVSAPRLGLPAPSMAQRDAILKAAVRAADHGHLRPWRFLFVEGEGLERLGELFVSASGGADSLTLEEQDRFRAMPKRAPLMCIAIAKCQQHPKVPEIEQLISAGAATQNLITAAFALGVGAVWRTGDLAYNDQVKLGLGLQEGEAIVGFIYLGTPTKALGEPREIELEDYFSYW